MRISCFSWWWIAGFISPGHVEQAQLDATRDTQSRKLDIILIIVHFEEEEDTHR